MISKSGPSYSVPTVKTSLYLLAPISSHGNRLALVNPGTLSVPHLCLDWALHPSFPADGGLAESVSVAVSVAHTELAQECPRSPFLLAQWWPREKGGSV